VTSVGISFNGRCKRIERDSPHVFEDLSQWAQSGFVSLVEPPIAVPSDGDESHVPENGQVLGHRAEGGVKAGCDLTGSHLLIPDHGEDFSPLRLGDDLKGVHHRILDEIEIA
jgi:hypothetical protein